MFVPRFSSAPAGDTAWVNALRALCMMAIYLCHSEEYGPDELVWLGRITVPFHVNAFFFVSGYLFFSRLAATNTSSATLRKRATGVAMRLIVPSIIFATLLYVPKSFFHGNAVSPLVWLYNVCGGLSFWFTSALAVAQFLLLALLTATPPKGQTWTVAVSSVLLFFAGYAGFRLFPSLFPYCWQAGCCASIYLVIGGVFFRCEKSLVRFLHSRWFWILMVAFIGIKALDFDASFTPSYLAIGRITPAGFLFSLLGIAVATGLAMRMGQTWWLMYTGRHTLVLYFLCGAFPAAFGTLASLLWPTMPHMFVLATAFVAFAAALLVAAAIDRFAPFLLDLRRLTNRHN